MADDATAYRFLTPLLEAAVGRKLDSFEVTEVPRGNSGTLTARVTCRSDGADISVFVKSRRTRRTHTALWYSEDAGLIDREYCVYRLLGGLDVPRARVLSSHYESASDWTLVLEDLAEHYMLPDDAYVLTDRDQECIVRTYAAIHSASYRLFRDCRCPAMACLQPEEGSQVDTTTAPDMLHTLDEFSIESRSLNPSEFERAFAVLLACRTKWEGKPRCLVFNDFDLGNVALPQRDGEFAVLFDWELAGLSLPQFDLVNIGHGNHSPMDEAVRYYLKLLAEYGVRVEVDEFRAGLAYAALSMNFYVLWLLHLKLRADPDGRAQTWMRNIAAGLFSGGLLDSARQARALH